MSESSELYTYELNRLKQENEKLKAQLEVPEDDESQRAEILENRKAIALYVELVGSLKAQLAEAQKDAIRYRFIRNQDGLPTPEEFDVMVDNDMKAAELRKE